MLVKNKILKAPQHQLTIRDQEEYVQLVILERQEITLKKTLTVC